MLVDIWKKKRIPLHVLISSETISNMRIKIGEESFNAIHQRLFEAVLNIKENKSGGYTVFGMILGEQSFLSKDDYDFIWNHMYKTFGKSEEAFNYNKRALGTLLMSCFAADERNWLVSLDQEKRIKEEKGEIPEAATYFLDVTGKGYQDLKEPRVIKNNLATDFDFLSLSAKFKVRRIKK